MPRLLGGDGAGPALEEKLDWAGFRGRGQGHDSPVPASGSRLNKVIAFTPTFPLALVTSATVSRHQAPSAVPLAQPEMSRKTMNWPLFLALRAAEHEGRED
ncbi:MAG: hypothetical protein M1818_008089 [Claussenomyces sp. TS43310]|nr:MAG: hypothetical protein M1818_008089 [Claussenomyces sp. TS43310]